MTTPQRPTATLIVARLDDIAARVDKLTAAVGLDHDALVSLTSFLKGQDLAGRMDDLEGRVVTLESHTTHQGGGEAARSRLAASATSWLAAIAAATMAAISWLGFAKGHP